MATAWITSPSTRSTPGRPSRAPPSCSHSRTLTAGLCGRVGPRLHRRRGESREEGRTRQAGCESPCLIEPSSSRPGFAAVPGRTRILPDDVKLLAVQALAHRVIVKTEAHLRERTPEGESRSWLHIGQGDCLFQEFSFVPAASNNACLMSSAIMLRLVFSTKNAAPACK